MCTVSALAAVAAGVLVAVPKSIAPAAVAAPKATTLQKFPDCLYGFSKDFCDGLLTYGVLHQTTCPDGSCDTAFVQDATLTLPLQRNFTLCSSDGKCDEAELKDGKLKVAVNYTLRLNKPCKYRGCIEGSGTLYCNDGTQYTGTFMGTLGAGTHRNFVCPKARTGFCEKCVDAEFVREYGAWRIGWEASFHGIRTDAATDDEVCISLSGDFYAPGNQDGIFDPSGNFPTFGTADGTWGVSCN
jgi:hypothetical protein